MTISRREKPVPTVLPSARLYLDDIEEIVRILTEAADQVPVERAKGALQITFEVGDRFCDDPHELCKIAK